jgi:murein DD-endopeptidase MepM/ murein hydrolase activator NlpD
MGNKKTIIIASVATALLITILIMAKNTLTPIVKNQKIRGTDAFGSGAFNASRDGGSRRHSGIDIVATPGEAVFSPISGKVVRIAYPYANDLSYKGLLIENSSYSVEIFYITPVVAIGSHVAAGQKIAVAQNIAAKYGTGMINHTHIEIRDKNGKLLNPTNMF